MYVIIPPEDEGNMNAILRFDYKTGTGFKIKLPNPVNCPH